MKRLVQFDMANGGTITAEVEEPEPIGTQPVALRDLWKKPEKADVTFEDALDQVIPATTAVIDKLSRIGLQKIEVEFGLKMNAAAGFVIASAGVEANFRITAVWEKISR